MATFTVSLPEPMNDWIETQVEQGGYASASDYLGDFVRRDRARRAHPELSLDDLRRIIDETRAGGISDETVPDIIAKVREDARRLGSMNRPCLPRLSAL